MTQSNNSISNRVVIAGGGVAGLEALLALRALARDRVALTLVSQQEWFVDRPMTVAEPFGFGSATRLSLPDVAAENGAEFIQARVAGVDAGAHRVALEDGPDLDYDTLILALGARQSTPFSDAITFGLEGSGQAIREMLHELGRGTTRRVAFVAPTMTGWLLPLYELALMTARELSRSGVNGVEVHLLSPENRPLELFGEAASHSVRRVLSAAGIEFIQASYARDRDGGLVYGALGEQTADYVVTMPLLHGPQLLGVPVTEPHRFVPVDEHGQVIGLTDVYAAGDLVDFPVKQGGLAAQQADAVAEHVAASYGASLDPTPFRPALRGMVFTGDEPLYMRSDVPGADPEVPGAWYPLWWPPTKVAGRYLGPYLSEHADEDGYANPPIGFMDVDIPIAAVTLPG